MGLLRSILEPVLRLKHEGVRWHRAFADLHEGLRPGSMLDIGCGFGGYSLELAQRLGIPPDKIWGLEADPEALALARRKLKAFSADLERDRLPLKDQAVELVCCNQILEHLKEVFFCLAECERVLKVGGRLTIGIPNLGGLVNRARLLFGRQPPCLAFPGPHVRGFTHRAMKGFLSANPAFELEGCRGSSLYPFPPPLLERGAGLLPGLSAYVFYRLRKTAHRPKSWWLENGPQGATPFRS